MRLSRKINLFIYFLLIVGLAYIFIQLGLSLLTSIITVLVILIIYFFLENGKLGLESLKTCWNSIANSLKYSRLIKKYQLGGEGSYISPEITFNKKKFFVVRYTKGFNPTKKSEGIIIFRKGGSEELSLKESLGVKRIFNIWNDIYFQPILSEKFVMSSFKEVLERDTTKDIIPKNLKRFKKIQEHEIYSFLTSKSNLKRENIPEELRKLDQITINQHQPLKILFEGIIKIIDNIYYFFEKPSDALIESFIVELDLLEKAYQGEKLKQDLNKKIQIWNKFQDSKRIEELKGGFTIGFILDLLQFLTKNPIIFSTMTVKIFEIIANLNIKLYNKLKKDYILCPQFGIDAAKQAIELERGIKGAIERYRGLIKTNSTEDIRNVNNPF